MNCEFFITSSRCLTIGDGDIAEQKEENLDLENLDAESYLRVIWLWEINFVYTLPSSFGDEQTEAKRKYVIFWTFQS